MPERTRALEREKPTVGIVLTAGWKVSDHLVIGPNEEGKIRVQGAVEDYKRGVISKIYLLGGAEVKGEGGQEAYLYLPYTKSIIPASQSTTYNDTVQVIRGGTETGSDLKNALENLGTVANLRIYSTSFHLGRVALVLKSLNRSATLVRAEKVIEQASQENAELIEKTLTADFLKKMYTREEKITDVLGILDHNPFIPFSEKLKLGSRLIEVMAQRR